MEFCIAGKCVSLKSNCKPNTNCRNHSKCVLFLFCFCTALIISVTPIGSQLVSSEKRNKYKYLAAMPHIQHDSRSRIVESSLSFSTHNWVAAGGIGGALADLFGFCFQVSSEIPLPFPNSLVHPAE